MGWISLLNSTVFCCVLRKRELTIGGADRAATAKIQKAAVRNLGTRNITSLATVHHNYHYNVTPQFQGSFLDYEHLIVNYLLLEDAYEAYLFLLISRNVTVGLKGSPPGSGAGCEHSDPTPSFFKNFGADA